MNPSFRDMVQAPENQSNVYSSYKIDALFGIDAVALARTERQMVVNGVLPYHTEEQEGLGTDPAGMWTHYPWFHTAFGHQDLKGKTVVDVGAGFGRLGLYLQAFHPEAIYVGLELHQHRVDVGLAAGVAGLIQHDILAHRVPPADIYWFYNALPHPAYEVFIKSLTSYAANGLDFRVYAIYDKYKGLSEVLGQGASISLPFILPLTIEVHKP